MKKRIGLSGLLLTLLLSVSTAWAIAPGWMPNFPMRMGAAGAMLMWMPIPGATEYRVYRQLEGGEWEQISKGPLNNFQDPSAPQDQDVSYKVVPVVGGQDGDASKVVTLKGLKPIDPPGQLAHRLQDSAVHLRWGPVRAASFYNVYRSGAAGGPFNLLTSSQNSKYVDTKIEDGNTYYYIVTSVSSASQESKKPEPYAVKVAFPKKKVVKKFKPVRREMKLLKKVRGEDFAELSNPTDFLFLDDKIFVAEQNGVQILDMDGNFLGRMPVIQEKVASREWHQPQFMGTTDEGTVTMTFLKSATIREFSIDGTQELRTFTIPDVPGINNPSRAKGFAFGPDGSLWVADPAHANVVVLPPGATVPKPEEVERIGWTMGSKEDPKKAPLTFDGASNVEYADALGLMGVIETRGSDVVFFDPVTRELKGRVGGAGGGLNKFKSLGDFEAYDDKSLLMVDVLGNDVRRIDAATGDYLESWVDTPEMLTLGEASNVIRLHFDPRSNRLYLLSSLRGTIYIYQLQ